MRLLLRPILLIYLVYALITAYGCEPGEEGEGEQGKIPHPGGVSCLATQRIEAQGRDTARST